MTTPISGNWNFDKKHTVTFVEGASGCGKSRCGYELYRRLDQMKDRFSLGAVVYMPIKLAPAPVTESITEAHTLLARLFIDAASTKDLNTKSLAGSSPEETFENVVLDLVSFWRNKEGLSSGANACIVLQIDEFQKSPKTTANIIRCVRDINRKLARRSPGRVAIIPVATGLVSKETFAEARDKNDPIFDVTDMMAGRYELPYLPNSSSDDKARVQKLFNNTLEACGRSPMQETLPLQLQMILDSCFGWPQAVVQLAGALDLLRKAHQFTRSEINWCDVEDSMLGCLEKFYNREQLVGSLGSETAVRKLFYLAMSPFAVCVFLCVSV